MKKNSKNKNANYPFASEIKQAKYEFKKMIDEMSDEEFIDFNMLFFEFLDDVGYLDDEEFEYDDYDKDVYDTLEECEDLPF